MLILKILFIMLKASHKIFMRGDLSGTTKSLHIKMRLANRSY